MPGLWAVSGDPLTGAGFAGAGILGLVLTWLLFKHLPEQNARMDKMVADFHARQDRLLAEYLIREQQREATFAAAIKTITDHYDRNMSGRPLHPPGNQV